MKQVNYTLPAYWASYLINNDDSGISVADKASCDFFMDSNDLPAPVSCSDESYFATHNDAGTLAGDVLDYTFLIK